MGIRAFLKRTVRSLSIKLENRLGGVLDRIMFNAGRTGVVKPAERKRAALVKYWLDAAAWRRWGGDVPGAVEMGAVPLDLPRHFNVLRRFHEDGWRESYAVRLMDRLYHAGRVEDAIIAGKALSEAGRRRHRNDILRVMLVSKEPAETFLELSLQSEENNLPMRDYPMECLDLDPDRVINVGLICDYVDSVIGRHTIMPQLMHQDHRKVRFYIYNFSTRNFATHKHCRHVRDLIGMPLERAVDRIRNDGVDILIEMNGRLRSDHRYDLLQNRAAPIQANWYNLPATTGLECVDYVLADEFALTEDQDKFYSERIWRLPGSATATWNLDEYPPVEPPPMLARGFVMFGSFADMFKYNGDLLDTWAEILHRVDNSRIFLKNRQLDEPAMRQYLTYEFFRRGVVPQRLSLEGISPFLEMRRLFSEIDIALDTFPFSSGSTSVNGLWQGVPIVSLLGSEWRSRSTGAVVHDAGLDDFLARTREEYIEIAVAHAGQPEKLAELRKAMRERLIQNSATFNAERFARRWEESLRALWRDYVERASSAAGRFADERGRHPAERDGFDSETR